MTERTCALIPSPAEGPTPKEGKPLRLTAMTSAAG